MKPTGISIAPGGRGLGSLFSMNTGVRVAGMQEVTEGQPPLNASFL